VVKGWAAERAAVHLAALPDTDSCLSAGGDITCRTLDPAGPPWRIGIEDPHDPSRLVAVVPVHTGAVATSGAAHRGAHVVDARTGRPPGGVASVTVIGTSLTAADIDATAAYALGPDAVAWLRTRPHAALVVHADGTTTIVDGPTGR
jgi:FAD:protein FMN transferase